MQRLTTTEVAALVGLDERRVRKDVEHGFFGDASPPRFALPAVVYFRAIALLDLQLRTADRRQLCGRIRVALSSPHPPKILAMGPIAELKLATLVAEVKEHLSSFARWKRGLVIDAAILAGEPLFPKSRLAVRQVGAMLLRGASSDELRADYPYLSDEDLDFARLYAEAYPRVGRPRDAGEAGEAAAR